MYNRTVRDANKLASFKDQRDYINNIGSVKAEMDSLARTQPRVSAAEKALGGATANERIAEETIKQKRETSKEREMAALRESSNENTLLRAMMMGQYGQQRVETQQKGAGERQAAGDVTKVAIQGAKGLTAEEIAGLNNAARINAANIRAGATTGAAGIRAGATVEVAGIRANAPSKAQSGELKGAEMLYRQALKQLRAFEEKFPLNKRMERGDQATALRSHHKQLTDDVANAAAQVETARKNTPSPYKVQNVRPVMPKKGDKIISIDELLRR
jgi:hypothetical protein